MSVPLRASLAILLLSASVAASAQGCVAIRSFATCNPNAFTNSALVGSGWQIAANYRYFESFRHFKGEEEQTERLELGNEVWNYSTQVNLGFQYNMSKRKGLAFSVPYSYNVRSSEYEHRVPGHPEIRERHSMRSMGLGDIRVSYTYWIWNPDSASHGNLQVSAGLKLPTGNFDYRAFWHNVGPDSVGEYRPVDQSIQPGDGGLGVTVEVQGYLKLAGPLYGYMNAFYLSNPMDVNGTRTYRETISPLLANEDIMSIPDQYMARLGLNWNISRKIGLNMFAGGRLEGIPVEDLVGSSRGFRRPGYVVSIEPGLDWMRGRHDVNISIPWAMYRNRTQSVTDKEMEAQLGTPRQGDAAFSDYTINLSWSIRLGKGAAH